MYRLRYIVHNTYPLVNAKLINNMKLKSNTYTRYNTCTLLYTIYSF